MPPISLQRSDLLDLPNLMPAQAQKNVPHNEALQRFLLMVQLVLYATERNTRLQILYAIGSSPRW